MHAVSLAEAAERGSAGGRPLLRRVKKCNPRFAGRMLSKGSTALPELFDCACGYLAGSIAGAASACAIEAAHSKSLNSRFRCAASDKGSKSRLNIDGPSKQFGGTTGPPSNVQAHFVTSERPALPCQAPQRHCGQCLQRKVVYLNLSTVHWAG